MQSLPHLPVLFFILDCRENPFKSELVMKGVIQRNMSPKHNPLGAQLYHFFNSPRIVRHTSMLCSYSGPGSWLCPSVRCPSDTIDTQNEYEGLLLPSHRTTLMSVYRLVRLVVAVLSSPSYRRRPIVAVLSSPLARRILSSSAWPIRSIMIKPSTQHRIGARTPILLCSKGV
jgi:hypothetical protein